MQVIRGTGFQGLILTATWRRGNSRNGNNGHKRTNVDAISYLELVSSAVLGKMHSRRVGSEVVCKIHANGIVLGQLKLDGNDCKARLI